MNVSAPWIRRPVATTLIAIGILLVGIVAYLRLPIAALPSVDRPTIGVWAGLPGASADTIASALAQPLERQIGTIPGIVEMRSFSATGGTQLTVQFALDKNIDAAVRRDSGGDQRGRAESAEGPAAAAWPLEGQPVGLVGDHAGAHLGCARPER